MAQFLCHCLLTSQWKCTLFTAQFKGSLERELAAAEADRDAFVADFGQEDYDEVRGLA